MNSEAWSTPDGQLADRPIHVYPLNDLRDHDTSDELCPCMPRVIAPKLDPESSSEPPPCATVIRHNSYDGREIGDVVRRALDLLGLALTDHHHQWSNDLREAYEHAAELMKMHYPAPLPPPYIPPSP